MSTYSTMYEKICSNLCFSVWNAYAIVSKVILRHALSTTQRYLGQVSDTEAVR